MKLSTLDILGDNMGVNGSCLTKEEMDKMLAAMKAEMEEAGSAVAASLDSASAGMSGGVEARQARQLAELDKGNL